jgi:hypothetical protein
MPQLRRSLGSTISAAALLGEAMTFSRGAGRKRQRGQTRRPWAGCCRGETTALFCVLGRHTHSAREKHTHRFASGTRTVRGVHTERESGRAGRRAEAQTHLSSYGFLSVTLDLVIEVHKGVHEYYSVAQCHQLPCTATLLSLFFCAYSARERERALRPSAGSAQVSRPRSLALLCGPTYADVARPPVRPPALRTETLLRAHVGPRPQ